MRDLEFKRTLLPFFFLALTFFNKFGNYAPPEWGGAPTRRGGARCGAHAPLPSIINVQESHALHVKDILNQSQNPGHHPRHWVPLPKGSPAFHVIRGPLCPSKESATSSRRSRANTAHDTSTTAARWGPAEYLHAGIFFPTVSVMHLKPCIISFVVRLRSNRREKNAYEWQLLYIYIYIYGVTVPQPTAERVSQPPVTWPNICHRSAAECRRKKKTKKSRLNIRESKWQKYPFFTSKLA